MQQPTEDRRGRIVVGVDGSSGSLAALRWAVAEAGFRDDDVEVLYAWHLPPVGPTPFAVGTAALDLDELQQGGEAMVERLVASAGRLPAGVTVTQRVMLGAPVQVLVDQSTGADLLVVGARGHGGLTGMLLGSVATQCAHHAHCAVVVVHPSASADAAGSTAA